MRRRHFIALLGATAVAWPLAARAQQPEQVRRLVVLMALPEDDREGREQAGALRDGLKALGWTDGLNIRIEFHWNVGQPDRTQAVARDIVAGRPDLIVSHAVSATRAVVQLTKAIPIVFVNVADPIGLGFVASYAQPSSNVTGFTNFEPSMGGKWVEVLKDLVPRIRRVAILFNPDTAVAGGKYYLPSFKAAGAALGVKPIEAPVRDADGIERAIDGLAREPDGGLVAMADVFTASNRAPIIRSALDHDLPLMAAFRAFPEAGGLISYGTSSPDIFHRAASYVDRILNGTKPSNLPVQAPTKYELVINLKTAKALGIDVPPTLLARADEVIE